MIKKKIKSEKGVTLVSLAIAVTVLVILSNIIIYNVRDNLKMGKLTEMQNDIENLRDKISLYYAQNGKIPAKVVYPNINHLKVAGVISEAVDTGDFLVIDLSAIENLTLNRGFNYENIKTKTSLTEEEAKNNTDIYIINEASHNIFYVAGIEIDNEVYYTDTDEVDTVPVDLRYVEGVRIPEGFHYAGGTKALGNIFIKNEDETEEYKWSSYQKYFRKKGMLDSNEVLQMAQMDKEGFKIFHKGYSRTKEFLLEDFEMDKTCINDETAIQKIRELLGIENLSLIQNLKPEKRDEIIVQIVEIKEIERKQLSRILGVNERAIYRAIKKNKEAK